MQTQTSYGVTTEEADSGDKLQQLAEELNHRGFAVIEDVLSDAEVDLYNGLLDEVYDFQKSEISEFGHLEDINDHDIVRCPLGYRPEFLDMATKPAVISLAKREMGNALMLLMQNGIINHPDRPQFQSNWHRDLNYQHWVCSKMICMSALFCLEDFSPETGGTVFLPGSHKNERFPSQRLVNKMEFAPSARKGSVIVFNAMTFHKAGVNISSRIRRAVNHVIGVPIFSQPVDIPAMFGAPPVDLWTANYLGYRWNPAPSVQEWRRRKFSSAKPVSV